MDIGTALKKIRTNLNLNLEEMSAGVITASHYSKIEKGYHRISAEDLLQILNIHSIDVATFLKNLTRDDHNSFYQKMNQRIISAFYQGNLNELLSITKEIEQENEIISNNKYYLLALAESCIYTLDDSRIIPIETKEFIEEKLFQLPNWNLFKLTLYANFVELYSIESNQLIISSILSKNLDNYSTNEQIAILSILLNYVGECIEIEEYNLAQYYLTQINLINSNSENFFYKVLGKYYENILQIINSNNNKSREIVDQIIQLMQVSGLEFFGDQLREYLIEKTSN